jgi:hypothetical protein
MRGKVLKTLTLISILILLSGLFFFKPAYSYLSAYLSKSEEVQANILLVEGWLSESDLEMVNKEFGNRNYDKIITTGLAFVDEYFNMYENGYLIFYPGFRHILKDEVRQHTISINAYGTMNEDPAHFNLYVNKTQINYFLADKHKRKYSTSWNGSISSIDSIMVQFTNDRLDERGDLNLSVKDVVIDDTLIIPYLHHSEYDISELDGKRRINNNYNSAAERAKCLLISQGIDSTDIIAVPGRKARINRTLTSALAFRDWLKNSGVNVKGINILSSGPHARRTWMTYNKVLDEKYNIGIISLPSDKNSQSKIGAFLRTVRETVGLAYYWLILIPY